MKINYQDIKILTSQITLNLTLKRSVLGILSGKEYEQQSSSNENEVMRITGTNYFKRKVSKEIPLIAEIKMGRDGNSLDGRIYEHADKKAAEIIREELHKYSHKHGITLGDLLN